EQALALAARELRARFGVDPAAVKQVAAEEKNHEANGDVSRTDWSFMFADPNVDLGKDAELRYVVTIAGDEVSGAGRLIHVPEAWERTERERENRQRIVKVSAGIVFVIAGLIAVVVGVIDWTK